ncbi:glycerophosphodiester phosphodiesterase [Egibacter rhizosphaerae]|uniref:Glycerophosphodiester phosphodiesterase n=1 Tax=Egibacter rhizosphaerae TaxID=1670831 RepID=A0A411YI59_9ACTN|nr:glycerophosphodiester phosphodiesterase [Egibacter rhizosphaerae]QBI20948.1 glycerophosphodiester phosphodiesterase [Egibacter rhizosphaerae]
MSRRDQRRRRLATRGALVAAGATAGAAWLARPTPVVPPRTLVTQRPTRIAHRGASAARPENTLAAFTHALDLGVDGLELDLRLTADGHVVVHHDPSVDRTTDGTGPVDSRTLAELRRLDAGAGFVAPDGSRPFAGQGIAIPTLGEVLTATDTFWVLELKAGGERLAAAVADSVHTHGAAHRVIAASFSDQLLATLRRLAPELPTSLSPREMRALWHLSRLGLGRWTPTRGVAAQVPEHASGRYVPTPRFLTAAHALGMHVHVWPINDEGSMHRLLDEGADGIITDVPDVLNAVLSERGDPRLHQGLLQP